MPVLQGGILSKAKCQSDSLTCQGMHADDLDVVNETTNHGFWR